MSRNERWEVGERPSLDVRVPVGTVEVFAGDAGNRATHDRRQRCRRVRGVQDGRSHLGAPSVAVGPAWTQQPDRRSRSGGHRCRAQFDVWRGATGRSARRRARAHRVRRHRGRRRSTRSTSRTASGEFSCGDVSGDAHVSSISGDCTMRRVGGRLDATLTSGDLRIDVCDGDVAIVSTSGDVRVGRCCGSSTSPYARSRATFESVCPAAFVSTPRSRRSAAGRPCRSPCPAADLGDRGRSGSS